LRRRDVNDDFVEPSELYDAPIDAQQAAEIQKRNAKPAGDYTTDPESFGELTDTVQKSDDGRTSVSFFGRATVTRKTEVVTNALRFKISPEARNKKIYVDGADTGQVDPNKDDLQTRLYAEAIGTFTQVNDEAPKNLGQLVAWLKSGVYTLNTMLGSDGELVVLHIKAPRKRR